MTEILADKNFESASSSFPVLLIGYNRLEKLIDRIVEVLSWQTSKLYISIDGGDDEKQQFYFDQIQILLKEKRSETPIVIIQRSHNLGLGKHLPLAVTEILENHDGVIVIEDDIKCSSQFYKEICIALTLHGEKYMTIGGFSSLPFKARRCPNKWRETKYFSAWGWGVTQSSWRRYENTINQESYREKLNESEIWNSLSTSQKRTWLGRFQKVASGEKITWDFQMQFSSFSNGYLHLNSLFRICENVGFGDTRGTNTKSKRPSLLGWESLTDTKFKSEKLHKSGGKIMEFFDSMVIAGDRETFHYLVKSFHRVWMTLAGRL
jgi:hypothetical protein